MAIMVREPRGEWPRDRGATSADRAAAAVPRPPRWPQEAHYTSIIDALVVTYLRSALQYARNMDRNVPAFPANMRVNQLEGLALFRSVEPLVFNVSGSAAAQIARVLDVSSNMPRADGSIDVSGYESASAAVEAAIDVLLDSMRMDKATQFGSLVV